MADIQQNVPEQATPQPKVTQQNKPRVKMIHIVGVVVVIIIIAAAYIFSVSGSGHPQTGVNTTNATAQQVALYSDLAKALNITSISVVYSTGANFTEVVPHGNTTVRVTGTESIDSYQLGNYSKALFLNNIVYTNTTNNATVVRNISDVYYYATPNNTITCLNQSSYVYGTTNGVSLECVHGTGGLSYLMFFPFTIRNVTALAYLGQDSISYQGLQSTNGRACDAFVVSNATSATQSNYSRVLMCLDSQYGIPLYFNETNIVDGSLQQGAFLMATSVSAGPSASQMAIPSEYLIKAANSTAFG